MVAIPVPRPSAAAATLVVVALALAAARDPAPHPPTLRAPDRMDWIGRFTCAHGVTGVRLMVLPLRDTTMGPDRDRALAVFAFFPLPENPGVGSGRFFLRGRLDTSAGGIGVALHPDEWIVDDEAADQPMVWLTATTDAALRTMSGSLVADEQVCTSIELTRTSPPYSLRSSP